MSRFVRNSCAQKLGFANAELLQDTDWDKVAIDPRRAAPKLPSWIFKHDPEAYAIQHYDTAVNAVNNGAKYITDVEALPPNYPPGYKYEPWSIEKVMSDMKEGKSIELGHGEWE